jgi:nickel-dependent lactate racemase
VPENLIQLPYGDGYLALDVPAQHLRGVIYPRKLAEESRSEFEIIRQALDQPVAAPRLRDLAQKGQRVAIITSDFTRPCPSGLLIPFILDELLAAGISDLEILIVLGTGIHRIMTPGEIEKTVSPEISHRIRTVNHDLNDTIRLGVTSRGTPVEIFRPLVEADLRICLGEVEYHWYAGFSGGAKAVLPGCASRAAILANHALMVQPGVGAGRITGNPLRLDLEEGCAMLGVDFLLNVVVENHRVVAAVAGDLTAAHRRGCEFVAERGSFRLSQSADIVIASAGGFPKDINLFQAHKGMEHASYCVRDGGHLVLVAECREGLGNSTFESWMREASTPEDIQERFRSGFVMGGHKALAIANIVNRVRVSLVSSFPDELVNRLFMEPYPDPQAALHNALKALGPQSQVLVLPYAGSTVPEIQDQPGKLLL